MKKLTENFYYLNLTKQQAKILHKTLEANKSWISFGFENINKGCIYAISKEAFEEAKIIFGSQQKALTALGEAFREYFLAGFRLHVVGPSGLPDDFMELLRHNSLCFKENGMAIVSYNEGKSFEWEVVSGYNFRKNAFSQSKTTP